MFDYIYTKKFPKPNEYFSYCCPVTKIPFNYNYPTKYDIQFLSMEYLGPIIFQFLNPKLELRNPPKTGPIKSPISLTIVYKVEAMSLATNSSKLGSYFFKSLDKLIKAGTFIGAPAPPVKQSPNKTDIILLGIGGTG